MTKVPVFKLLITISIYCCVFANGICSNIYGPTWLDLKSLMNTTLEKMAWSISLRSIFFCGGALIGAFVFSIIDRGALYPICILTKGLCVALIPLYANFYAFLSYSAIIGLVSGTADSAVNVWMLDIWQDKSAPFVQALQAFWALGFIVSPLISQPFLSPDRDSLSNRKFADSSINNTTMPLSERLVALTKNALSSTTESSIDNSGVKSYSVIKNDDIASVEQHMLIVQESKLYIPYMVAGSICLVGSISLLMIYVFRKLESISSNKNKTSEDECVKKNQFNEQSGDKIIKDEKKQTDAEFETHPDIAFTNSKCYIIQVLLFSCIMISVFCASEMTTFQFIATFCVKLDLGLTKITGSYVMSAVATSFAAGRFFGILCAMQFKNLHILWADWAIILIGNLILTASNSGEQFLWIGAILIGFGYASFFAAIFSFLRDRITVTTKISSVVILASLSGNAIGFPVFIGRYMESMPLMMIYGNLACLLIMFICFIGLQFLDSKFGIKVNIIEQLKKNRTNEMTMKLKADSTS